MANVVLQAGNLLGQRTGKEMRGVERTRCRKGRVVGTWRGHLLLHPSEEGIVVLVCTTARTRVGLAIVLLIGEMVIVHIDVLALAVEAVAIAHA
jgi:hypothetical protein